MTIEFAIGVLVGVVIGFGIGGKVSYNMALDRVIQVLHYRRMKGEILLASRAQLLAVGIPSYVIDELCQGFAPPLDDDTSNSKKKKNPPKTA